MKLVLCFVSGSPSVLCWFIACNIRLIDIIVFYSSDSPQPAAGEIIIIWWMMIPFDDSCTSQIPVAEIIKQNHGA